MCYPFSRLAARVSPHLWNHIMSKLPLVIALGFSCLAAPVLAADSDSAEQKPDSPPAAIAQSTGATAASKPAGSFLHTSGGVALRVGSIVAGSTLGIPIAAARLVAGNDVEQAKSMPYIGESSHKGGVWLSRLVVIPSSVFVGFLSAPAYSTVNSWRVSGDKPFSKEIFGLGHLDETICPY